MDQNQNNMNALSLKGWIYLSAPKEELQQKSLQYFDHVVETGEQNGRKYLESMMGRAKFFEKLKKYEDALEILSEISVCFTEFQPAVIEKAKCHILSGEWDQAVETISGVIAFDRGNTEALRIYIFYLLARENDQELFEEKMDELVSAIRQNEGRNSDLIYNISRLFARYSSRKQYVLDRTLSLLDMAIMHQPENAAYYAEIGSQKAMICDFQGAYQAFQKAVSFDESLLTPLYGMINCRIKQEMIDDAQQQLEFVTEIGQSQVPKSAEHAYLEAVIEWRKKGNKSEAIRMLDQSLNLHISQTKTAPSNIEFYIRLNADFLMTLAQEYLVHCGVKPKVTSAGPPKHLVKAIKLLENVTKQNTAMLEAQVQLSKARWLFNDTPGALRELSDVMQKDSSCVEAHIMAALINSEAGNMKAADNYLKQAFAQDFSIRENPVFMLMKSEVEIR
jgi:tetratricopeptide (TPR) repeat protein